MLGVTPTMILVRPRGTPAPHHLLPGRTPREDNKIGFSSWMIMQPGSTQSSLDSP